MKTLLSIAALLILAACAGFHPVYGVNKYTHTGVEEKLALVDIGNIPDREGQYLRNALIDRFYRTTRPANATYSLYIQPIRETLIDLDITKSSDATRGQLRLDTALVLSNAGTGEVLLERDLRTITSYNILASEFSTRVTEDSARTNALDDIARQVETQLTLYFKRTQ
jgi:LPS-assembly lipoprotein